MKVIARAAIWGPSEEAKKMISGNSDIELLLTLNSLVGSSVDIRLWDFGNNTLLRGFPIFFPLVALWFSDDCIKRRSRMLAGLSATCLAVFLSVWLQHHITAHTRPLLDPALHLSIADPQWATLFRRQGSFPSDTATLFFSLAAIIFLENRLVGCFCFLWVLVIIAAIRVVFWMALSKRHRWLVDSRAGMRLFVYQNSIPCAAI